VNPNENPDGAELYFAWVARGTPFNPSVHAVNNTDVLAVAIAQRENDQPTAKATFPYVAGDFLANKQACHISCRVEGVVRHLFYGVVSNAPIGRPGREIEVEFLSTTDNDDQLVANLLAPIAADPVLYVPQFGEATDLTDASNILAACTIQLEYDRLTGRPALASIFGDPNRIVVATADDVPEDSFERSSNGVPARGAFCSVTFEHTQRRVGTIDIGAMIQDELDIVADAYGGGYMAGNFTFTPDFIDSFPKDGASFGGSWVVVASSLYATGGPGTKPKTDSSYPGVYVWEEAKKAAGQPKNQADQADTPYLDNAVRVLLEPTDFSRPVLEVFGVQSKPRKEIVTFYVPYAGQQLVHGNGPPIFLNLDASGLDEDETTPDWKGETEYEEGDVVQDQGVRWRCLIAHKSGSSLLTDLFDKGQFSVTQGAQKWEYDPSWGGVLGSVDVESVSSTAWGTNALRHAIRRAIVGIAYKARTIPVKAVVPIRLAWRIDTRTTFRLMTDTVKGGMLEGKVTDLAITFDGDSGDSFAEVTFICTAGEGAGEDAGDEDGDGTPDPGEDVAVAGPGGDWDRVKYIQPLVLPDDEIADIPVKGRVDWIGPEQRFALANPETPVLDPYSSIGLPRGLVYYPIFAASDFLEQAGTEISFSIADAGEGDSRTTRTTLVVTRGWKGPKQVTL
jgi:hypothetical protein